MHHSLPEGSELSLPLRFTLQALSAPSISVKASHYKVLFPQSTSDYFLIYRSQLTHHHSDCFRASGSPFVQGRGKKKKKKGIDFFLSRAVEVRRYYVPVTAGCAASWSERLRTADHTGRGCWITLTNLGINAEYTG